MSRFGSRLASWAMRQIGSYLGYTGRAANVAATAALGRVEMWRGFCRSDISVSAPFVWRCLSGSTVAPFPHPAHRTGLADLPHLRAMVQLTVFARQIHTNPSTFVLEVRIQVNAWNASINSSPGAREAMCIGPRASPSPSSVRCYNPDYQI